MDIQLIDMGADGRGDRLTTACQKCNHNFRLLSRDAQLLPYEENDTPNLPLTKFISSVDSVFKKNSEILGYHYPELDFSKMDRGEAIKLLFEPVAKYFESLTAK